MRDLVLLAALLCVFPLILRAPQIGILAWIWVALMSPQQEVYGFLGNFELNFYIAILTAVAWVFSREKKIMPFNTITVILIFFGLWISITTYYALQRDFSYVLWDRTIKTLVLALAIMTVATTKARLQAIVWVLVLSLGYYGVKGGGFVLLTGGGFHVFGPHGSQIEDNNALGLALVMLLPFINYLRVTSRSAIMRIGLLAALGLSILGIVGTYSRGALLALGVSGAAYALKSRSGLIPLVLGGLIIVTLPSLVPNGWFARMSSIQSYSEDGSFQGRIAAWKTSFNIAAERVTGGGFSSVNLTPVVQAYRSPGSLNQGLAAHSIYFEVLGDHGFIGLVLYLMLLAAAWYNTSAILAATRDRPELDWAASLARMMQVSMIGYVVGGAALSMAYYDGFLIVIALTGALLLFVRKPLSQQVPEKALPIWRQSIDRGGRDLAGMRGG